MILFRKMSGTYIELVNKGKQTTGSHDMFY